MCRGQTGGGRWEGGNAERRYQGGSLTQARSGLVHSTDTRVAAPGVLGVRVCVRARVGSLSLETERGVRVRPAAGAHMPVSVRSLVP